MHPGQDSSEAAGAEFVTLIVWVLLFLTPAGEWKSEVFLEQQACETTYSAYMVDPAHFKEIAKCWPISIKREHAKEEPNA